MLLIFFTAISLSLSAQWSTNPAVNNAIADMTGEQVLPKVAVCPNGNIYIAYFSNQTGFYNVRLQKLDSQGNELWAHTGILISDHPTESWVTDWDMTADIANHAVLTFADTRLGNSNIVAYRISPDGTFTWGPDGIQLSNNSAFNAAPKVTTTAAGNAIIAWTADDVIMMQKINPAGVKQWGANGITLSSANDLSWPQLMPVGTDDFIMKYFDDSGTMPYPTRLVYAQRYNSSGSPVWASPAVISNAAGIAGFNQIFPMVNDGNDGFFIAWHDDRDNNMRSSVFVHHISSTGQALFSANGVEASTASTFNHFYPYLALPQGSSDIYVFWNEMDGNQNYNGLFGQKLSSTGARQWGTSGMTFIPLTAAVITPEAAEASDTDMALLYTHGNGLNAELKAMRIGTDGSFVWPTQSITVSSVISSKVHTVMSTFNSGQWITAWEDNRNDANDVYAQNFSIEGTLGPYEVTVGNIQGHVTLAGGTGNVTQVVVTAGDNSTLPDPTGDYFLETETGTYNVIATLTGYYPDTVYNVTVLENQTTNNVDFELLPVPTTGYISGTVTLVNGSGDVTQVVVTAGSTSTNPDATGFYSMELGVGTWSVEASLEGYTSQLLANVVVNPGLTTANVNFNLSLAPATGFLYGTVTIEGDMADVTQASVTSGTTAIHPDANGDYILELPVGSQEVTASHPYTQTSVANVDIIPGSSTEQDFTLLMLRRDLLVTCHDQFGDPLYGSEINITGPDGEHSGILETDTLIFSQVPYGIYAGEANYYSEIGEADTIVNQYYNRLDFEIILGSAQNHEIIPVSVSPNPVSPYGIVTFNSPEAFSGTLSVYDATGRKVSEISVDLQKQSNFPVTLLLNRQDVREGQYFLHFVSGSKHFNAKLLIKK